MTFTPPNRQMFRARNSLICSKLIRSLAHLLISLKSNEWLWAILSDHSRQMSHCEQIAQVAQDKWATMSDSLRSLMINEQMRDSLKKFWLTKSNILFFSMFLYTFFLNERFARSLFFGERCERLAQVAHQTWAMWANYSGHSPNMSEWANCSGRSPKMSAHEPIV